MTQKTEFAHMFLEFIPIHKGMILFVFFSVLDLFLFQFMAQLNHHLRPCCGRFRLVQPFALDRGPCAGRLGVGVRLVAGVGLGS